jgi:hypothetical protein
MLLSVSLHSPAPGFIARLGCLCALGAVLLGVAACAAAPDPSQIQPATAARSASAHPPAESWPSFFGIGSSYVNGRSADDLGRWLPAFKAIGVDHIRTINAPWHVVQPRADSWDWRALDQQMDALERQGVRFGVMLWGNPGWSRANGRGGLPTGNLEAWSRYVAAVSQRVKGRANRLEIWNEPPNGTLPEQTPADYARLVVASHRAAKAVDARFQIGLSAKSVHLNYLDLVIRAGAADHYDFIVLHPYEVLDSVLRTPHGDAIFRQIVPSVRRMLRQANPSREQVPVVFTELGVDARKGLDVQADGLVKALVMGAAQGVASIHWFEGMDGDSGPLGLWEGPRQPRPAFRALAELVRWLGPQPQYAGPLRVSAQIWGYRFTQGQESRAVVWGPVGALPTELALPLPVTVVSPASGQQQRTQRLLIGPRPVIVLDPPSQWVPEGATSANPAIPPAVDPAAQEVSIRFDGAPVARGLYTLSAEDVAAGVRAYGGSVRSGSVPHGNLFAVDPAFLSVVAEPIEITVEVKRSPTSRNPGFKLVYEAATPSGFKSPGDWFHVPAGPDWARHTWRLSDARFVNQWGYGFALVSDCPGCADYLIRSVSVRKLGLPADRSRAP